MRNTRFIAIAAFVCVALATAGIAIAKGKTGDVTAASATFNATTVAKSHTRTCTVSGGDTYAFTRATYTGTAVSSDARLNGPMTISALSIVDQTTGVGALVGSFKINGLGHPRAAGKIEASLSGGQASGMVRAHIGPPGGELFAGINGGFTASGGFSGAGLGSGSSTDTGVVLSRGACVKFIPLGY